jgi:hypothetical protein
LKPANVEKSKEELKEN